MYVGSTTLSPTERFAQHRAGGPKTSRHVRKRGIRLRRDLAPTRAFARREDAQRAEHTTASRLKRRGHTVYGACTARKTPECFL